MYLLIDNYDSFTYNLYQAFAEEGVELTVKRNDEITLRNIEELSPAKIVISPGPRTPDHARISNKVIDRFGEHIPILGICLGHQCIASVYGAGIKRVDKIVHGRTSDVYHDGKGLFRGLPNPFPAARYHSLEVVSLPPCLRRTAWTEDDVLMGLVHSDYPVMGLQFHPESFLTGCGKSIIKNFMEMDNG